MGCRYLFNERNCQGKRYNWCEEYRLKKEILVNYNKRGKQLIILDYWRERIDEEKEADILGTNEMAAPLGSVRQFEPRPKAVVQSNVPGNDELAATDENDTNEMAAPEMISKTV